MKLFFQRLGEGPAIIILHGLFGSSDNWITIARKLANHFTIYLVDQRNHGRSPHHPEHNYKIMAEDVQELITSENLKNVILLGHSMGGKTAMFVAALYPEEISALIVVDIGPGSYVTLNSYAPQALSHLNIINAMLSIDFSKTTSRTEIEHELAKTITDLSIRQFIMKNVARNSDNSLHWKLNISSISKALPAIMGSVNIEKILQDRSLNIPTLFIKGEKSNYINDQQRLLIQKYFPTAKLEIIKAGHWVHADQPEEFINVIDKFLITLNMIS